MTTTLIKNADWGGRVGDHGAGGRGPNLHGRPPRVPEGLRRPPSRATSWCVRRQGLSRGPPNTTIDGRGKARPAGASSTSTRTRTPSRCSRACRRSAKSRQLNMSSLYEYIFLLGRPAHDPTATRGIAARRRPRPSARPTFRPTARVCQVAISEMLRSGTTCFVDYSAKPAELARRGSARTGHPHRGRARRSARASGTRPTATRCCIAGTRARGRQGPSTPRSR